MKSLPDPLAELEARYRQLLRASFEHLTARGLSPTDAEVRLPLEQLYVHLNLVAEVPPPAEEASAAERRLLDESRRPGALDEERARALDDLRYQHWMRQAEQGKPRSARKDLELLGGDAGLPALVLLGDPGSGKSTLLHLLALRALRPGSTQRRTGRLPLFVPLAAYDDFLRGTSEPLPLERFLALYSARWHGLPGLEPLFQRALKEGRALVLLDGLDEVLSLETRRFVARQVEELLRAWTPSGNRFVLTSRFIDYREVRLPDDVPHFLVLGFGPRERARFIHQWCEAQEVGAAGGQRSDEVLHRARQHALRLREDLRGHPRMEQLASNPLRLTLLMLLWRELGPLPASPIELQERYVRALLSHGERGRSEDARRLAAERLEPEGVEHHLTELALWLQFHRPSGTASRADLKRALAEQLLRQKGPPPQGASAAHPAEAEQRADQVLQEVQDIAGLLGERGRDAYGFLHPTLQDYFVGRALARESAEGRWELLRPHLHEPRWQEPLLLCAARLGRVEHRAEELTALVRAILHAHSDQEDVLHRDLLLAAATAAEDVTRCGRVLEELVPRLEVLRDSAVPSLRTEAVRRLGRLMCQGHEPALVCLLPWLQEHPRRLETLKALEKVFDASAPAAFREELLAQLDARDPREREALVRLLAHLVDGDERVREALIAHTHDRNPDVSLTAVEALAPGVERDVKVRQAFLSRVADRGPDPKRPISLGNVSSAALNALGSVLEHHEEVRTVFLALLDYKETQSDVIPWLASLVARDEKVREALLARLVHGSDHLRQALIRELRTLARQDETVRDALLALLTRLDDKKDRARLRQALTAKSRARGA